MKSCRAGGFEGIILPKIARSVRMVSGCVWTEVFMLSVFKSWPHVLTDEDCMRTCY